MHEEILQYLENQGFTETGNDSYQKNVRVKVGTAVINGVEHPQYQEISIVLNYIGEGFESDMDEENKVPLDQWRVNVNDGQYLSECLVHDLNEFREFLGQKN